MNLFSVLLISLRLSSRTICAMRRTARLAREAQQRLHDLALQDLVGKQFGNYVLEEHYKSYKGCGKRLPSSFIQESTNRTEDIPPSKFVHGKYKLGDFLGSGAYGAAYLASHVSDPDERVVLKFIYTFKQEVMYVATGSRQDDKQFGKALRSLASECDQLQKIQRGEAADIRGANRIVKCLDMCMSPKYGEGDCDTPEDSVQFIVMDYAGQNGEEWLRINMRNKHKVAHVLANVAEGLNYLSTLDPPVIHHDMKWANIAVKTDSGGPNAKLIDFGASIEVTGKKSYIQVASTPGAAPPEWHEGYAYYGPAHAFDAYSLGTMILEGLCDLPWFFIDELRHKEIEMFRQAKNYPNHDIDLGRLGLKDLEGGQHVRRCRETTNVLLHPDPRKRWHPKDVGFKFADCNFETNKTCIEITQRDGTPFEISKQSTFYQAAVYKEGFLQRLDELLGNGPQKADDWKDLGVAWGWTETVQSCVAKLWQEEARHNYFKDMTLRIAMKRLESDRHKDARLTPNTYPFCLLLDQVDRKDGLKPLSDANDRKFSACVLNLASNVLAPAGVAATIRQSVALTQVALLQWGQIWNRREIPMPSKTAKGSQFAYGLLYGSMTSRNFVMWRFEALLDKVKLLAQKLYKYAGESAAPSWSSHVHTYFSGKAEKKYRRLYRQLYWLFNARLQAVAVRVACAADFALRGKEMLKRLHQVGHTHVSSIRTLTTQCSRPINPEDALSFYPRVLESAAAIKSAFMQPSADLGREPFPELQNFDDTHGWDHWQNFSRPGSNSFEYGSRDSSEAGFNTLLTKACPAVSDPPIRHDGMYSEFRDHVVHYLMSGLMSLFDLLEKRGVAKAGLELNLTTDQRKKFLFGAAMKEEARKAGQALADYVSSKGYEKTGFNSASENAANMEMNVLGKFYGDSSDDDYDDLGFPVISTEAGGEADQPGGIFHVKQLIAAVLDVVVHPSQDNEGIHLTKSEVAKAAAFREPPRTDMDEMKEDVLGGNDPPENTNPLDPPEHTDAPVDFLEDSEENGWLPERPSFLGGIFSWT